MSEGTKHPDLFTADEAVAYLHLDGEAWALEEFVSRRLIPCYSGDGFRLFYRADLIDFVDRWLAKGAYAGKEPLDLGFLNPMAPRFIYFLFDKDALVYIGQTIDLNKRLAQHRKEKGFDRFEKIKVKGIDCDSVERGLIAFYRPPLNVVHRDGDPTRDAAVLAKYGFGGVVQ